MKTGKSAIIQTPELQAGKAEVSMAPLIDVVFLLLIFFIVATVFPENRGLVIEKPESETAEKLNIKKITFVINEQGVVHYKNQSIKLTDVRRMVKEQMAANDQTGVLIEVDKKAPTESLISVLDACKLSGAKQISIATDAIKRESPSR